MVKAGGYNSYVAFREDSLKSSFLLWWFDVRDIRVAPTLF